MSQPLWKQVQNQLSPASKAFFAQWRRAFDPNNDVGYSVNDLRPFGQSYLNKKMKDKSRVTMCSDIFILRIIAELESYELIFETLDNHWTITPDDVDANNWYWNV